MAAWDMNHRERLEVCFGGGKPDRIPVAMWRHFPVEDQSPGDLAAATMDFQRRYEFDFVKVTPASSYCLKDWGVEDAWRGSTEGTRDYTRRVIRQPEDWERLPVLDPNRGYLSDQLECLRMLTEELGAGTPVIQTVFNPLSQAKNLAGQETLLVHLRRFPEAVRSGLKTITESTQRFVAAARQAGIAGVFFAVQHAQYSMLSEDEYSEFGCDYDLEVLEPARDLWLNVLHLHGEEIMFDRVMDYPVAIINWHDRETRPSLPEAKVRYSGVVCGGLKRWDTMVLGSAEQVMSEVHDAIHSTGGERFILGTG